MVTDDLRLISDSGEASANVGASSLFSIFDTIKRKRK